MTLFKRKKDEKVEEKVESRSLDATSGSEADEVLAAENHETIIFEGEVRIAPTEEEIRTLRKVRDNFPFSAFLVAIVELAERFTYYGLSGPFQNYMQLNRANAHQTGGLGLGKETANGLSNFFQFWCYVTPIPGAMVADMWLGKYHTIFWSAWIYTAGCLILFVTSIPKWMMSAGEGGLIAAMIVIGIGTGGIKANVSTLIADQYRNTQPYLKTLKSGERVIVDPATTMQYIFEIFYMCINVGSLSAIATTELEAHVDFWAAYLLPFCFFFVAIAALVLGRNSYVRTPPRGSPIPNACRIMWMSLKNGFASKGKRYIPPPSDDTELTKFSTGRAKWRVKIDNVVYRPFGPLKRFGHRFTVDIARPSVRADLGLPPVQWTETFVDEVKRALYGCSVFVFFPIYWVVYNQMINNFTSQAGQMDTHKIPNDLMQNIDPIAIIIFIPCMEYMFYPMMRKLGFEMLPITRIFWGFVMGSLSMGYAAIVQHIIYSKGPCFKYPVDNRCPVRDDFGELGNLPNNVHVAVQTPAYVFIALSEIFASITGLEYAYTKAPVSMKSFIMSLFLLTSAFGSALNDALTSTTVNPKLMWMYIGLAISCFIAGIMFWFVYQSYNDKEKSLNLLDQKIEQIHKDENDEGGETTNMFGRPPEPVVDNASDDGLAPQKEAFTHKQEAFMDSAAAVSHA